jgi:hypothetical protein
VPAEIVMSVIELNRRFVEWKEKHSPDLDFAFHLGISRGGLGWDDLLKKRRVVLLAEAGSGKSEEMAEQAKRQNAFGHFAFYIRVQDLGHRGLEAALQRNKDRERLAVWRTRTDHAWFFVDSVDEAKLLGVDVERAVQQLADGIAGAERRSHIVLSGRLTDWEFRRDFERFERDLAIPGDAEALQPLLPDQELLKTLRFDEATTTAPKRETALVVLMSPLDADRVRRYAEGKCAPDLVKFLDAIERGNLWRFARRPLDLEWLV